MSATLEIKSFGDVVVALWPGLKIVCEFSRFTEHRDSLSAELAVTNELGPLHWSRINLASATGRQAVVKALEESHPIDGWRGMLDRACQAVAHHLRTGEPAQEIVMVEPGEDAYLVTPWVPLNEITVLYGPGGTAKSLVLSRHDPERAHGPYARQSVGRRPHREGAVLGLGVGQGRP